MNFDDRIKDSLSHMNDDDLRAAEQLKSKVWSKLDINQGKKQKSSKKWLWALLFFLLGSSGAFVLNSLMNDDDKNPTLKQPVEESIQIFATEIIELETKLKEAEAERLASLSEIDQLKNRLSELLAIADHSTASTVQYLESVRYIDKEVYLRDTVFVTKVDLKIQEIEKIVRDTVYVEIPMPIGREEPVAEVTEPKKARKVQYNFSGIDTQNN